MILILFPAIAALMVSASTHLAKSPAIPAIASSKVASPLHLETKQSHHTYWDGNNFVEIFDHQIRLENTRTGETETIKMPHDSICLSIANEIPSCLRMVNDKILFSKRFLNGRWENFETSLNRPFGDSDLKGLPISLIGSSTPKRFLALNLIVGFGKGKDGSPCAWWKENDNGILEADTLVPIELGSSVFIPTPETDQKGSFLRLNPSLSGLAPFLDHPIKTQGSFAFVSMGAGILWIIKDDQSRPNAIKLLPTICDKLTNNPNHPRVIYEIQPMQNGHILAAMRSPDSLFPSPPAVPQKGNGKEPDVSSLPPTAEVLWMDIDPITGTVSEADGALLNNAPRVLPLNKSVSFKFNAKGQLIYSN